MVSHGADDTKYTSVDEAGFDFDGDFNSQEGIDLITTWLRESGRVDLLNREDEADLASQIYQARQDILATVAIARLSIQRYRDIGKSPVSEAADDDDDDIVPTSSNPLSDTTKRKMARLSRRLESYRTDLLRVAQKDPSARKISAKQSEIVKKAEEYLRNTEVHHTWAIDVADELIDLQAELTAAAQKKRGHLRRVKSSGLSEEEFRKQVRSSVRSRRARTKLEKKMKMDHESIKVLAAKIEECNEKEESLLRKTGIPREVLRHICRKVQSLQSRLIKTKHLFAQANLRLVISVAKRYRDRGLPFLDLIQEGNLGLLRAIEKFDHHRGFKFSTYATYWIRQSISRSIGDRSKIVRLPVHLQDNLRKMSRAKDELAMALGREPLIEEVAGRIGESVERTRMMENLSLSFISLDTPIDDDGKLELAEVIPDHVHRSPSDTLDEKTAMEDIEEALTHLSEREQEIVRLRYGLRDGKAHTLEELGKMLGVTRERVRQLEMKALKILRHPMVGKRLSEHAGVS